MGRFIDVIDYLNARKAGSAKCELPVTILIAILAAPLLVGGVGFVIFTLLAFLGIPLWHFLVFLGILGVIFIGCLVSVIAEDRKK